MILVMDVGNTNIEMGLFLEAKGDERILATVRYFTRTAESADELAFFILKFLEINHYKPQQIQALLFSSVVPQINEKITRLARKYFGCRIIEVDNHIKLGIENRYRNPDEVGSDRLVNASYVYHRYRRNTIIVDMGTATTFCAVTSSGEYLGGVIVPGVLTASSALFEKAAKLHPVAIKKPEQIIGDDTSKSLSSGIYYSNYYAIKGIIEQMKLQLDWDDCLVVATGGYASLFDENSLFDEIDDLLALKGLKHLCDLNHI